MECRTLTEVFIAMKKLENTHDAETGHHDADMLLLQAIKIMSKHTRLTNKIIESFGNVEKWYS